MDLTGKTIAFLKKIRRFFIGTHRVLTNFAKVYSYAYDPKLAVSYYPDQPRKSKLKIYFENLWWLLRHQEINEFYYLYGFDRKDCVDTGRYMDYLSFRKLRDRVNGNAHLAFRHVDYRCLLADKFAFAQYVTSLGFVTPRIIALCDNKSITWLDKEKSEPWESLLNIGKFDLFIKDLTGQCAEGVYHIDNTTDVLRIDDKPAAIDELRSRIKGLWIIQERFFQHPKMAQLHPSSVNTIRFVSTYASGKASPFGAALRIGVNGNCYDNWAHGGILCGIDYTTGRLKRRGVYKPGFGTSTERHPQTGVVFEGFEIPYFHKAISEALRLHHFFYGIHSIGWDIAIGEEGPVFIEGNDNWAISVHQLHDGGLKKKYLESIYG